MSTACIPIEKAKPGMKLAEDVSSVPSFSTEESGGAVNENAAW